MLKGQTLAAAHLGTRAETLETDTALDVLKSLDVSFAVAFGTFGHFGFSRFDKNKIHPNGYSCKDKLLHTLSRIVTDNI